MNSYHINTGLVFQYPYLSDYALLRQCQVANPGISFQKISARLREIAPEHRLVIDRLRLLRPTEDSVDMNLPGIKGNEHIRQCPQCAMMLYHTNIYVLPWLTHCPLHHCEFSEVCPVCHKPWPAAAEISSQHCRGCGVFGLNELSEPFNQRSQNLPFYVIPLLYRFIRCWKTPQHLAIVSRHGWYQERRAWHQRGNLKTTIYPAFCATQSPEMADLLEKILDCKFAKLNCKTTQLYANEHNMDRVIWGLPLTAYRIKCIADNIEIPEKDDRKRAEHDTAWFIQRWINKQTDHAHRIRLSSYRQLTLSDLGNAPPFCPYCMAFSLWFFHTATLLKKDTTTQYIDLYPFLHAIGVTQLAGSCEPLVEIDYRFYYSVDDEFSDWFYRRGLEVSFIGILQLAFDLYDKITQKAATSGTRQHILYPKKEIDGGYHLTKDSIDSLDFYYEKEHPLECYHPESIPHLSKQCQTYHKHHLSHKRDNTILPLTKLPMRKQPFARFTSIQNSTINAIVEHEAALALYCDPDDFDKVYAQTYLKMY